jgi:hypothetical protein
MGMIGAKVAVQPEASLAASTGIDFVARNEFDFTIKEVAEGRDFADIAGLSWRKADGTVVHNEDRAIIESMDELPFVTPVYKRDLVIENYFGGYLKHPYISFYTPNAAREHAGQIAARHLPVEPSQCRGTAGRRLREDKCRTKTPRNAERASASGAPPIGRRFERPARSGELQISTRSGRRTVPIGKPISKKSAPSSASMR